MENDKGQSLIENLLIFTVIGVTIFSMVKILGSSMQDSITKSNCDILDKIYVIGKSPGTGYCIDK